MTLATAASTAAVTTTGRGDAVDRALEALLAGAPIEEAARLTGLPVAAAARYLDRRLDRRSRD